MGFMEIVLTVCALSAPYHCQDQHLQFAAGCRSINAVTAALHRPMDQ
jgi:hypothetical protein